MPLVIWQKGISSDVIKDFVLEDKDEDLQKQQEQGWRQWQGLEPEDKAENLRAS